MLHDRKRNFPRKVDVIVRFSVTPPPERSLFAAPSFSSTPPRPLRIFCARSIAGLLPAMRGIGVEPPLPIIGTAHFRSSRPCFRRHVDVARRLTRRWMPLEHDGSLPPPGRPRDRRRCHPSPPHAYFCHFRGSLISSRARYLLEAPRQLASHAAPLAASAMPMQMMRSRSPSSPPRPNEARRRLVNGSTSRLGVAAGGNFHARRP